jgi:hypothetical protein
MERLLWCIVWYYTSDQASNRVRLALHRMQSRLYTAYAHAKQTLPQIYYRSRACGLCFISNVESALHAVKCQPDSVRSLVTDII